MRALNDDLKFSKNVQDLNAKKMQS